MVAHVVVVLDFSGSGMGNDGGMHRGGSSAGDDGSMHYGGTCRSGVYHSGIDCSIVV